MGYTKGPWKYAPDQFNLGSTSEQPGSIKSEEGWYIATIENIRSGEEALANAHLIAAAPDLLEACQSAVNFLNLVSIKVPDMELIASICIMREMVLEPAIARAKGEVSNE